MKFAFIVTQWGCSWSQFIQTCLSPLFLWCEAHSLHLLDDLSWHYQISSFGRLHPAILLGFHLISRFKVANQKYRLPRIPIFATGLLFLCVIRILAVVAEILCHESSPFNILASRVQSFWPQAHPQFFCILFRATRTVLEEIRFRLQAWTTCFCINGFVPLFTPLAWALGSLAKVCWCGPPYLWSSNHSQRLMTQISRVNLGTLHLAPSLPRPLFWAFRDRKSVV